jgi:hypothetical protein
MKAVTKGAADIIKPSSGTVVLESAAGAYYQKPVMVVGHGRKVWRPF